MKYSKTIYCAALAIFASQNTFAQEPPEPKVTPQNQKIVSSELKENGYWGVYQELPYNVLLDSSIWQRSDPKTLEIVFRRLKAENRFPPLFALAQASVFSGGLPPPQAYPKLIEARFLAAIEIGEINSANELTKAYYLEKGSEDFATKYIDNLFYESKIDEACGIVEDTKPSKPNKNFLEMRAACYALNNETSAALLNIDLANQIGSAPNIWLNNVVLYLSAIKDGKEPTTKLEFNGENGVNYALSAAAKLIPNSISGAKNPMKSANAMTLSKIELENPYSVNAYLFGAINANSVVPKPLLKTETPIEGEAADVINPIVNTLNNVVDIYEFYALSKKFAPSLSDVSVFTIDDAPRLLAAAIIGGNLEQAQRFNAALPSRNNSLSFALEIAQGNNTFDARKRFDGINVGSKDYFKTFGELLCASQAGIKIENFSTLEASLPITNDGQAQILLALENAAHRKAKAETILIAQLATQNLKPSSIDFLTLGRIIGALNGVGYKEAAKDVLIFAILAQNLSFASSKPAPPPVKNETKPEIKKTSPIQSPKPTPKDPAKANKTSVEKTPPKPATKATPKPEVKAQAKPDQSKVKAKTNTPQTDKKKKANEEVPNWGKNID